MKTKILPFFARTLVIGILIFTFTIGQFFLATKDFGEDTVSSACITCSLQSDILYLSIFDSVILILFFSIVSFIKSKCWKITIELLLLCSNWFFWNLSLVKERITSWSTFTLDAEIYYTISISFFPIIVLAPALVFIINYKNTHKKLIPILLLFSFTSCKNDETKTKNIQKQSSKQEAKTEKITPKDKGEEWLKEVFRCKNSGGYCYYLDKEESICTKRFYEFLI